MLVGIENFPRLGYIYRSDGAASEVKRCLGSLSFSQARHWYSSSLLSRRAARKRAGMVAGTVVGMAVGVAVGVVSAGARQLASVGAIPMHTTRGRTTTRRPTMRDRLAAGRACAYGETDTGRCDAPGAAGDRSSFFCLAKQNAPLTRGITVFSYFHALTSTKCPVIAAAAAMAGETRWVRPL